VARREDPVHLYYNFIQFLVISCSEYTETYEVMLLGVTEVPSEIPYWIFSKTIFAVKVCLVGSLTGVVAS
jgi:hypothetical protein